MNLILLTAVFTVASAQVPSRNYIPQGSGGQGSGQFHSSGGFGGQHGVQNGGFGGSGGHGGNGNTRPQQAQESKAAVVQQNQEIDESGSYHFSYETENGIRAEEAGNPGDAQGGFSYKGDDGQTYTITYTSGEGGFRPQGAHLPIAPPTPEAILEALAKNAKDEAAGIFDDGLYRPDTHGGPSGGSNGGRRPSFGGNGGHGGRGGQGGQGGFGGSAGHGSHQNGFNQNSGYTY